MTQNNNNGRMETELRFEKWNIESDESKAPHNAKFIQEICMDVRMNRVGATFQSTLGGAAGRPTDRETRKYD